MVDLKKVCYLSTLHTQTLHSTQTDTIQSINTVVALAQSGNEGQVGLASWGWAGKLGPG